MIILFHFFFIFGISVILTGNLISLNQVSLQILDQFLLLFETSLVSSSDNTQPDSNLLLFQESQFSVSNIAAPIIHAALKSGTPTSHFKQNSIHNKHDLKDERIEQLNAELKALKSFIREELYLMKKMIEDLQGQKSTPNHSVVAESLKEELIYVRNENLTKIQIIKTITENQHLPSTLLTQSSSNTKEQILILFWK